MKAMVRHKCATWLLLVMLTGMLSLRTTVLGYCLCTDSLLLSGDCCCEHQTGPEPTDNCCPSGCGSGQKEARFGDCDSIDPCPGDFYFSFEHDNFLAPSPRVLDPAAVGPLSDALTTRPAPWQLKAPDHPRIASRHFPPPPILSPGAPPREWLQSWLI